MDPYPTRKVGYDYLVMRQQGTPWYKAAWVDFGAIYALWPHDQIIIPKGSALPRHIFCTFTADFGESRATTVFRIPDSSARIPVREMPRGLWDEADAKPLSHDESVFSI
ncbi:hypothetical protein VTL71DRAFT_6094 [Oculimacula yallundae]|uniref:Uncharacterized protein n=1 Tax=Oculimacula yallundae TaxID=86028 RepID=A0ABR4BZH1_9HELO